MSAQVDNYFSAFDNSFFGVSDLCGESNKGVCSQCSTAVACSDIPFYDEQAYDDENGRIICSTCHSFNNSLRQLETPTWDKKEQHTAPTSVRSSSMSVSSSTSSPSFSSSSKNAKRRKRAGEASSPVNAASGETPIASPRPKKKKVQRELTHEELMAALASSGDNPVCALEKFTVPQIQDMLRKHKASTKGSKPQLIQRLVRYTSMWEQQGRDEIVKRTSPPASSPATSSVGGVNVGMPISHSTSSLSSVPVSSTAPSPHPHSLRSSPQPSIQQSIPAPVQQAPSMQPVIQQPLQQSMQQHMPPPHQSHPAPPQTSTTSHPHAQHLSAYQSPDHHLIWQQQLLQQHLYQQQFYQHVVQVQLHQAENS